MIGNVHRYPHIVQEYYVLPLQTFLGLSDSIGTAGEVKSENLTSSALPQNYADRYGWREMVDQVKAAYDTLSPQEKAEACILTSNYGEAGAIDFYGPALGLPRAISGPAGLYRQGDHYCQHLPRGRDRCR